MDDIEHYGRGLGDLPPLLDSLSLGSRATGVGYAWSKFSAFASDWEAELPHLRDPRLRTDGALVTSWDIWSGGVKEFTLPRSAEDSIDKLLGKRGTARDRHSLAALDLLAKLEAARRRLSSKCCSWDECRALLQWVLGGSLNYTPLVGLPDPASLHREDAALHRLLHSGLGTRVTAEHVSLSAPRSLGGLDMPLTTELMVSAADLCCLLNGSSQASLLSRDALRQACLCDPSELDDMRFLAGYGLFLSLSTDRFVCRMLDYLAPASHHPLVGPYRAAVFDASARFSRVGVVANSVRRAWCNLLSEGVSRASWSDPATWARVLPEHAPVAPAACARAASSALSRALSDWRTECALFHAENAEISEEWAPCAWEDPWQASCDLRSRHLLQRLPPPRGSEESALFGDGGFVPPRCATFCCQSRGFGSGDEYWRSAAWASSLLSGRLPARWGWEECTVHTAELFSLVCSLKFRRPSQWRLLVFDRSALFSTLRAAVKSMPAHILSSSCLTLVTQLRHILLELEKAWSPASPKPSWRLHQEQFPSMWDVTLPLRDKQRSFSKLAFLHSGVVGVDIRSHQSSSCLPFPVLVSGNEAQDAGCSAGRRLPPPADVFLPSGGPLAWYSVDSRMVTGPIRAHVRSLLRRQSTAAWSQRAVQGLLPRVAKHVFCPPLDPSLFLLCSFPSPWVAWCLPSDSLPLDLSAMVYRLHRAIGGSWTERLHSTNLQVLADSWCALRTLPTPRLCPLCATAPGTPRHVVMSCPAMAPLVDRLRDAIEAELANVVPPPQLLAAADAWSDWGAPPPPPPYSGGPSFLAGAGSCPSQPGKRSCRRMLMGAVQPLPPGKLVLT